MSQNKKRIVIKIGSSSLTSAHGEISRRKLEKLVDEVVRLKDDGHEVLLVSSGAVAAGYRKLGCLERPSTLPEKQAAASIGQGLLMESYSDLFLSHGYMGSQILITRSDFSDENRYNNARNTINVLLERGIIPIVNENDTITIDRLKFGDNDTLSAKVAGLVDADQLIILSDIDGLYDADPRKNSDAKLLDKVHEITPEIEAAAGDPGSAVGTGGMKSKIDAFKISMASGIASFLGKANTPNIVYDAVYGDAVGTYFEITTDSENLDQKKQWIAFNSGPEGKVIIDHRAKETVVDMKQSLMPGNVHHVTGRFEKGAVVRIQDLDGEEIGLGVVNYSSEQMKNMINLTEPELESYDKAAVEQKDFVCHLEVSMPVGV
ncbi:MULTISPECIES: glutamate 5-kinase [Halobacillus]|uniref:glutamate 5-kinase n=1 Tax=Halobacillus TaxID=45667 RepID=UPI001369553E|nr:MULTISPECIES: glutamate 5-kinase [Halobacillus]MCA1022280.1 glutamate 5-kinase [Halobacillus litoralis]MYL30210.1 glutamate 5-kinase [Halobacillus halophilus]MYL38201.1 glutamate 5-kinase [Halobacillus litoralis]